MEYTRRAVLAGLGLAGLGATMPRFGKKSSASSIMNSLNLNSRIMDPAAEGAGKCPFRLAVINDEITQDFEKACQI
ncbi:MAG: hypothetical protein ABSH02_17040, partial [Candidatus Sulfotelmatobacter sp.]